MDNAQTNFQLKVISRRQADHVAGRGNYCTRVSDARDPNAKIVVMDGHAVIDDGQRLSEIPCGVFEALDISVMVHLEGDPEQIVANRRKDTSRSRPSYSVGVLEQHQEFSRAHANLIADVLNIPFYVVTHNDIDLLVGILKSRLA